MSESVVVASGSARRDHLIWLSCKRNANQFAPITVESWPCRPIANLRSWPQATNKTPSVFQISWRNKVNTTKRVIRTQRVPDVSPTSRVGRDKPLKQTSPEPLNASVSGPSVLHCSDSFFFSQLSLSFCFSALLRVTSGWRGHRILWWKAVSLLMWAVSLKAAASWKAWKGKKTFKQSLAQAVCWHNVFPVTRLC